MNPGDRNDRRQSERAGSGGRSQSRTRENNGARQQTSLGGRPKPPETVEEALARALVHGRNALAESLLAGRSLLDAASIGLTGQAATATTPGDHSGEASRALARAAHALDGLSQRIRVESPDSGQSLVQALLDALDVEIARWEARARQDQDARAVLRAFLGLRELLWELGMRPSDEGQQAAPRDPDAKEQARPKARKRATREPSQRPRSKPPLPTAKAEEPPAPRRKRVQRVEVER
jgi:hypothetical protein